MSRRWPVIVGLACVAAPFGATRALADGLPVLGAAGAGSGVVARDGSRRYLAQPARRTTIVTAVAASGRTVVRALIPGRFDIPVVAYDGSSAGLSADGHTLVLIRPRRAFPQASTELAVLDARTLRPRRLIALSGDFSFDAVSPDGRWAFLIQYTSAVDFTQYRVRALDVATGRLRAGSVVDPTEPHEAMRGNPVTRVVSADGRVAYTLYDGDGRPFVHALDTATLTARCLDVAPFPATADPWSVRLRLVADRLSVIAPGGRVLSQLDTRTLFARSRHADASRAGVLGAAIPVAVFLGFALTILCLRRPGSRLR